MFKRPLTVLFLIFIVVAFMMTMSWTSNLHRLTNPGPIIIGTVDLSVIPDGEYDGEFKYGNFVYKVKVTMEEHRIKQVAIVRNRKNAQALKAEDVVARVVQFQTLQVDPVPGTGNASRVLLKAIEKALVQ
jgi:uncharacterized protein with FMN-binding domain